MNETDINEKISAYFEPKPRGPLNIAQADLYSPHMVWCWEFEHGWQPLDYLHSEDANARLRTAMLCKPMSLSHWADMLILEKRDVRADNAMDPAVFRKLQVLAFCKFAGIEVSL